MMRYFAASVVLVLTAGCHKGGTPEDPKMLAGVLNGDAKGGANSNPMCRLLSVEKASAYAGISLNAGVNAEMDGCGQQSHGRRVLRLPSLILLPGESDQLDSRPGAGSDQAGGRRELSCVIR
jgi:hypothetical protein